MWIAVRVSGLKVDEVEQLGDPSGPGVMGDAMNGSYLGPAYRQEDIERRLTEAGARFTVWLPKVLEVAVST